MSDICAVTGLFHVLVKSNDLPQTLKFYKEVLGLREAPRPAFGNPGAWMAVSTPIGEQIIHVWAYENFEHRSTVRAAASKEAGWPPAIREFVVSQQSEVFLPAPFSPTSA